MLLIRVVYFIRLILDRVMMRICRLTKLLAGLCLCLVRENGAYQQSDAIYSIVSSPDLPSDYANNADASFSGW